MARCSHHSYHNCLGPHDIWKVLSEDLHLLSPASPNPRNKRWSKGGLIYNSIGSPKSEVQSSDILIRLAKEALAEALGLFLLPFLLFDFFSEEEREEDLRLSFLGGEEGFFFR